MGGLIMGGLSLRLRFVNIHIAHDNVSEGVKARGFGEAALEY